MLPANLDNGVQLEMIVAILVAPLILKLATWIPRGMGNDPEQPTTGGPRLRTSSGTESSTPGPQPRGPADLAVPFVPHHRFREGSGAGSCLLNVYRHCGHELAAQQQADPTCVAFINHVFPSQRRVMPGGPSPRVDPGELAA